MSSTNPITITRSADWFDTYANGGVGSLAADPLAPPIPGYAGGPNLGFGNARKDTFVGPGRVDFTTSLYKNFAMTERAHFEFRAESYNTFNHTEFNQINTTWTNSTGRAVWHGDRRLGPARIAARLQDRVLTTRETINRRRKRKLLRRRFQSRFLISRC